MLHLQHLPCPFKKPQALSPDYFKKGQEQRAALPGWRNRHCPRCRRLASSPSTPSQGCEMPQKLFPLPFPCAVSVPTCTLIQTRGTLQHHCMILTTTSPLPCLELPETSCKPGKHHHIRLFQSSGVILCCVLRSSPILRLPKVNFGILEHSSAAA